MSYNNQYNMAEKPYNNNNNPNRPSTTANGVAGNGACWNCGSTRRPIITRVPGTTSWVAGFIICIVFWPLFWLPCVLPGCMDETAVCPDCNRNR
ncbi:11936_t:CDS:2 [Entrophospora sp. SA101]|nr:11936_t:CDS:2 [Entrophospora sp. SA101]CAJ0823481.1 5154_t:CDS:2 [Entrophospora sp. SA101]